VVTCAEVPARVKAATSGTSLKAREREEVFMLGGIKCVLRKSNLLSAAVHYFVVESAYGGRHTADGRAEWRRDSQDQK
jgi:hypothetical protein